MKPKVKALEVDEAVWMWIEKSAREESGGKGEKWEGERSMHWGEWNRLQPMVWGMVRLAGQVELHHSLWFLPPLASSRSWFTAYYQMKIPSTVVYLHLQFSAPSLGWCFYSPFGSWHFTAREVEHHSQKHVRCHCSCKILSALQQQCSPVLIWPFTRTWKKQNSLLLHYSLWVAVQVIHLL